ncbi:MULTISPECIES: DUF6480 family protein [Streptomyces]|uniref:DUF6480 family protein n=1 Tax=Streptomyces TaxID=1883 RepID=UPI000D5297D1|nr:MULTISPECIES: DUF6480 family protein [Streptomyces]AWE53851.1 hypothetical protein DC008_31990 [Streptomyces nigra]MCF2540439.1 DUF6480 family protein [Streptomyces sp. FB2]
MTHATPQPNPEPGRPPNPDPEPERTTGLEPGGSVPPGETPPAESSMSGAGPRETHNPPTGWAKAPLTLILLGTALIAAFFLVYALILIF